MNTKISIDHALHCHEIVDGKYIVRGQFVKKRDAQRLLSKLKRTKKYSTIHPMCSNGFAGKMVKGIDGDLIWHPPKYKVNAFIVKTKNIYGSWYVLEEIDKTLKLIDPTTWKTYSTGSFVTGLLGTTSSGKDDKAQLNTGAVTLPSTTFLNEFQDVKESSNVLLGEIIKKKDLKLKKLNLWRLRLKSR